MYVFIHGAMTTAFSGERKKHNDDDDNYNCCWAWTAGTYSHHCSAQPMRAFIFGPTSYVLSMCDQCFLQGLQGVPSSARASAHRNVFLGLVCTTRQFTQPSRHLGPASSQTTAPEKNLQLSQHLGNSAARTHGIRSVNRLVNWIGIS